MSDTGARPWWAEVQHLRPAEDRERETRTREARDAALEDVRTPAPGAGAADRDARDAPDDHVQPGGVRGRIGRAGEALGAVATLVSPPARGHDGRDDAPPFTAPAVDDRAFDDELASWLDAPPAEREREIELIVEEPAAIEAPGDLDHQPRRGERFTTDDWLALTAPTEHRDPDTGRRTIEIRGQVDGLRGVAAPDPEPGTAAAARAGGISPRRRPVKRPVGHIHGRPDRVAMWAFVLGMVLILVALLGTPKAEAATRLGDRALETGMEGRDVRHLQLRLKRAGFFSAPATARFGTLTKRAVRSFQRSRCLTPDGVAGTATIRALRAQRRPCRRAKSGKRGASGKRASASRRVYRRVDLGTRTLAKGMRGRDVRTLQALLGQRSDGVFGAQTKRAVRRFQRRAGLTADGAVGPATRTTLAQRRMRTRKATWYGPGLYGNRTACGQKMTRRLQGVAHRRLPCGTRVLLHYGGRFVAARVVDRGPYANGATFDLTAATARRIGLRSTDRLDARY